MPTTVSIDRLADLGTKRSDWADDSHAAEQVDWSEGRQREVVLWLEGLRVGEHEELHAHNEPE